MHVLKVVAVFALLMIVTGCSATSSKFTDLSETEQVSFHGTQTGYNRLSDHYVAAVDGGRWDTRLMQFFYYPHGEGRKQLIGVTSASLFDAADYGPQNEHFAVSADGRSILYFHEGAYSYGKTTRQSDGLYLYTHGEGIKWIRPIGDHTIDPAEIDRYLGTN